MSIPLDADHWAEQQSFTRPKDADAPSRVRFASLVLRTVFIVLLLVVIAHVSMPQSETLWTVFDTPGDVVRLVLGIAACVWIAFQLFTVPHDPHAHRTWLHLGLVAVPFVLICIIAIW